MAIDIVKGVHGVAFPSKVLSAMGGKHIFNITLTANHDNGELVGRGTWNSIDNYNEAAVGATNDFRGVIQEPLIDDPENQFYVEVTADTDLLFVYNSPVSPYPEQELSDESLFYNKAGDTAKGYSLSKGDIILISKPLFNGTPAVGAALTYKNGKYVVGS